MAKIVYDVETNDKIMANVDVMWIMVILNKTTGERFEYLQGDLSWQDYLNEHGSTIIGHNIIGYDNVVLKKLFDFEFKKGTVFHDTLIMSQILDYRRFGHEGHSLAVWGDHLGFAKVVHEDWSQYSPEMNTRCNVDVSLNDLVYDEVMHEFRMLHAEVPYIKTYLQAEHWAAQWQARAEYEGWPFDKPAAELLLAKLEILTADIRSKLEVKLGNKAIATDKVKGVVLPKTVKITKAGYYVAHLAKWFGIDPRSGFDMTFNEALEVMEEQGDEDNELVNIAAAVLTYGEKPVQGEYCRVEFRDLSLSSPADVKMFLYRQGWEPTEWNVKREDNGSFCKTSPKITDDSLDMLGGDGPLYNDFKTMESRVSIIRGWIENTDENGLLHGNSMLIGTPSMRTRHQIIVNVPSGELTDDGVAVSPWGPEMRALFGVRPGWKAIGCDSSGNQARGLAYYLGDEDFVNIILHGDIHTYNKDKMTEVLASMGIEHDVPRSAAKRILYAFLFGASGKKLWSYIFGSQNAKKGNQFKKGFVSAVPGFKVLVDHLEHIFNATRRHGYGYIPSLAGNKIYVDSLHKLLVYLLQSLEKITCSTAVMLTMQRLEAAGIPYQPLIYYHDEEDFMVPEEYAEEAAAIGAKAFKDGPAMYDITIMDGDAKIGDTWLDIH